MYSVKTRMIAPFRPMMNFISCLDDFFMYLNWKKAGRLILFFGLIGMGAFIFLNMDLAHRKRDLYLLFAISLMFFISGWVGLFRYSRFWMMLE